MPRRNATPQQIAETVGGLSHAEMRVVAEFVNKQLSAADGSGDTADNSGNATGTRGQSADNPRTPGGNPGDAGSSPDDQENPGEAVDPADLAAKIRAQMPY